MKYYRGKVERVFSRMESQAFVGGASHHRSNSPLSTFLLIFSFKVGQGSLGGGSPREPVLGEVAR